MATTTQPTQAAPLQPTRRAMMARGRSGLLVLLVLSLVAAGAVSVARRAQPAPPPAERTADRYLPSASYEYDPEVASRPIRDRTIDLDATNLRQQLLIGSGPSQPSALAAPIDYQFDVFHNVGQQLLIGSGHGSPPMLVSPQPSGGAPIERPVTAAE